jgi:hypothetical protein
MPVWVAPMAMHGLAHPDREVATTRAAMAEGVPYVSMYEQMTASWPRGHGQQAAPFSSGANGFYQQQ